MKFLIKKEYIFLLGFLSLYLSYYFGENSSGGAYLDSKTTLIFLKSFDNGLLPGLEWFILNDQIHLPFFYYIKSILLRFIPDNLVNIFYLFLSSLIPLVLYKCLRLKFSDCDQKYIFSLSLLLYFSPYFRSSAAWFTADNLATLFFFNFNLLLFTFYS